MTVESRMKPSERFAYGIGDFGINLYFMSVMSFLLGFYTDVFGLSAAVAAWVFLVARIIDAVTDPLMGYIADRTRTRHGAFRPYLVYGAVPLGIISVATFTVPGFDETGKIVWAFVTYSLFGVVYTVVTIPYAALTAVLTNQSQERTTLSTVRMACAFTGGLLASVGTVPLVNALGGGAGGWQLTLVVFSVVATIVLFITFLRSSERDVVPVESISAKDAFRALLANRPLAIVIFLFTFGMLAFTFRQASAWYYFKYNMGRPDLLSLYFFVTLGIMTLSLIAIPKIAHRFEKAGAIRVGACIAMVAGIGFYLTPPSSVLGVFVWGSLLAIGGAPVAVLGWAMIPDTVEYAQWKTGVRADGVIFSTASFFQKLAKALGGAAVAGVLGWFGYVANVDQTPDTLNGINIMMSICPLIANVCLFAVSLAYPLDARTHAKIVAEISDPRADDPSDLELEGAR